MFVREEQSGGKTMAVRAYDNGIYLARNKDTFNYSNKKASEIFTDICARFEIPVGEAADTIFRIPELPKPKSSAWDVITDALSQTFKSTGIRYYVMSKGGRLNLIERRRNILQWVIETGRNLESYNRTKSIERINTRIKLISREGSVLAQARSAELEKKIGVFQDVVRIRDDMNSGQLTELVNTTLAENNKATQSLTVKVRGLADVITGVGVFVIIEPLGVSRTYYVEEDVHIFKDRDHDMKLTLSLAGDVSI